MSVQKSNEKLNILYSRLIKVFPDYAKKYSVNLPQIFASTNELESSEKLSSKEVLEILEEIDNLYKFERQSLKSVDEIDFSSHELDDVINAIKHKKHTSKETIASLNKKGGQIVINKTRLITLDTRKQESHEKN